MVQYRAVEINVKSWHKKVLSHIFWGVVELISIAAVKWQIMEEALIVLWCSVQSRNPHIATHAHLRRLTINPQTPTHNAEKWPLIFNSSLKHRTVLSFLPINLPGGAVLECMSNNNSQEVLKVKKGKKNTYLYIHSPLTFM